CKRNAVKGRATCLLIQVEEDLQIEVELPALVPVCKDSDAAHRHAVVQDLFHQILLIAEHLGITGEEKRHKGLLVDHRLGSVPETEKRVELSHHQTIRQLLYLEVGLTGNRLKGS